MTFLPIVTRELQVRARSRPACWSRFTVAAVGLLLCLPHLLSLGPFSAPLPMGRALLNGLVAAAFLSCCAACLLTSDIISSERRQGTLGLLLLTRVNALDVLVGKLASAGLTSLCALLAFLPMLMITVLAGGVTGGEAFRKELVLLDTLFLSLTAGLWASARGQQWSQTGRNSLIAVAVVVLVPLGAAPLLRGGGGVFAQLSLLSPLGGMSAAADLVYKSSPAEYWASLLLVQAVGWVLLLAAGLRLRRAWREERGEATVAAAAPAVGGEAAVARPSSEPLDDATNPITWRLQRQHGLRTILWAGALAGTCSYWALPFLYRLVRPGAGWSVAAPLTLALAISQGVLFAWAASRFFVEARRTGELELLLTTPVGARRVVAAQWEVLRRALRWPLLVMILPGLLQAGHAAINSLTLGTSGSGYPLELGISSLMGCANTILGVGALCWLGMWFGLKASGQGRAIAGAVAIGKGVPFVISMLTWLVFLPLLSHLFLGGVSAWHWVLGWLAQALDLLFFLAVIWLVRRRLLLGIAAGEQSPFGVRAVVSSAVRDAAGMLRRARHWTPS